MFIHQIHNSIGKTIYNAFLYKDFYYQPHLHKAFEITIVTSGSVSAMIDGKKYELNEGAVAIIPPFTLHSYQTKEKSECFVVVFSEDYVRSFANLIADKKMSDYVFYPSKDITELVLKLLIGEYTEYEGLLQTPTPDSYTVKGCVYLLASEFTKTCTFSPKQFDKEIFQSILEYIEINFKDDISLETLSQHLGYNYSYTSRVFSSCFNVSFNTLLNQFRVDHAKNLITSTDMTMAEIGLESGFNSIRNFNRTFKDVLRVTPQEYKKMQN